MTFSPLRRVKSALLILLLGSCFQIASAQSVSDEAIPDEPIKKTKFYDVEIIIFKNLKVPKGIEKVHPIQAPTFDERYIDISDPNSIKNAIEYGYSTPTNDELRLKKIVHKISKSRRYKLLAHTAWRQPGLEREEALSFKIRGGDTFGNDFSSIDNPIEPILGHPTQDAIEKTANSLPTFSISNQNSENSVNEKIWYELEGKITISLGRYLHAYVDLVLRIPSQNDISILEEAQTNNNFGSNNTMINEPSFISATLNNYSLKEHRRMRSRKLHFLDHPEFGMLILITPYEEPEPIEFIEESLIGIETKNI